MKNYYRQFITLIQERADFALPGGEAAGRIVLEARGETARANVYIQDISPQNSYKLAFVARQDGGAAGVVVGSIVVSERGKFDGRFEFDSRNICKSNIGCEDIEGAIIMVANAQEANTGDGEVVTPLVGFKKTPWPWRNNFKFAPCGQDFVVTQKSVCEDVPQQKDVHDDVQQLEPAVEAAAPIAPVTPILVDTKLINQFFADNPAVNAFGTADHTSWVAVTPSDIKKLGDFWANALENPHVDTSFERYRHILLGKEQVQHETIYLLAVPDVYRADANCGGIGLENEYCTFKLCRPENRAEGAPGYWLRVLGRYTG